MCLFFGELLATSVQISLLLISKFFLQTPIFDAFYSFLPSPQSAFGIWNRPLLLLPFIHSMRRQFCPFLLFSRSLSTNGLFSNMFSAIIVYTSLFFSLTFKQFSIPHSARFYSLNMILLIFFAINVPINFFDLNASNSRSSIDTKDIIHNLFFIISISGWHLLC